MSESLSFSYIVPLAFWTVLIAELVGDKSIYALTSLTLRFRAELVFASFALASAAKMLIAVLLGRVLSQFQSHWTYLISGVAFLVSAILIWTEGPEAEAEIEARQAGWATGALACFASFFLTEWGDPGQISAAALMLKSHQALGTWLGGTLAIMTKGAVVLTIGLKIRDRLPQRALRLIASTSCCILGILALSQGMLR
jgi:putative Ca2+/H+ antiporter (TMEM165/GDT1 family)